ncbi:hypothetical protein V2J09_019000 [Rumex salicifolius]
MDVTAADFLFPGLNIAGNTNNQLGLNVKRVDVRAFPALNTLGISLARVDLAPYGVNPPHFHPRGTQVTTVLEGVAYVGFVTSNIPDVGNKFFTKVLYPGDVFVFPQATIHFEMNVGKTPVALLVAFSSQDPGVTTIANATFGSDPLISADVLSKAFQLDKSAIKYLQSTFGIVVRSLFVNNKFCKNPNDVTPEDFLFKGINKAGNTDNQLGSDVTRVDVNALPALNTLGISLAHAVRGQPASHPSTRHRGDHPTRGVRVRGVSGRLNIS